MNLDWKKKSAKRNPKLRIQSYKNCKKDWKPGRRVSEIRELTSFHHCTLFTIQLYILHNLLPYIRAFSSRSYFFSSGSSSILLFSCCFPSHIFVLPLCFDRTKEGKWKAGCCSKKEFSQKTESSADGEGLSIHVVLNVAPSADWQLL